MRTKCFALVLSSCRKRAQSLARPHAPRPAAAPPRRGKRPPTAGPNIGDSQRLEVSSEKEVDCQRSTACIPKLGRALIGRYKDLIFRASKLACLLRHTFGQAALEGLPHVLRPVDRNSNGRVVGHAVLDFAEPCTPSRGAIAFEKSNRRDSNCVQN